MKTCCVDFNDEILIPNGDAGDFGVVACDQFSSRPEYWRELEKSLPPHSALELILPECFLSESEERLPRIRKSAREMLDNDRFYPVRGAVAVTRTTSRGHVRRGVVASIRLADYDFKPNTAALIRASERTIEERIPPRVAIREAIDIELPHILLLIDDRERAFTDAVSAAKKKPLYEAELKGGGGKIKGELIEDTAALYAAVESVISSSIERYSTQLFALVGDGNHSLATAKYCSEHTPTPFNDKALVEIIDIYDEGLMFEPIHRLVRVEDPVMFTDSFKSAVKGGATTELYVGSHRVEVSVPEDKVEAIERVDRFCETFVKHFGGYVEYVHGEDSLSRDGCVGIKMRGIEKSELFGYVLKNGVLPKKTFSLGEADEKRYYIEARRIK